MPFSTHAIVLFSTFASFCSLYAPQPIQLLLAQSFGIEVDRTTLLVTVTLIPLGAAPVVYGYFLQAVPARLMLSISLGMLALNQLAIAFIDSFSVMLALRFIQGMLLPAIFTSLMTYCSTTAAPQKVRSVMIWYITFTIIGGFGGRVLAGIVADLFGWQAVFLCLSLLCTLAWLLVMTIKTDAELDFSRLSVKSISQTLNSPLFLNGYSLIAVVFFIFAALLNLLPYRVHEIDPYADTTTIAWMYTGYLSGSVLAVFNIRLSLLFAGETRLLFFALFTFLLGIVLMLLPGVWALFAAMFVLASGMFMIHSTLSSYLNHIAVSAKGIVNGLYVSFYYLSGAMGSWLPAYLYQAQGWDGLIAGMFLMGVSGLYFITRMSSSR